MLRQAKMYITIRTFITFPCFFGIIGEQKGELRYAYINQDDWSNLPSAVEGFLDLFKLANYKRHDLFVFVEPFEQNVLSKIIESNFGIYF